MIRLSPRVTDRKYGKKPCPLCDGSHLHGGRLCDQPHCKGTGFVEALVSAKIKRHKRGWAKLDKKILEGTGLSIAP